MSRFLKKVSILLMGLWISIMILPTSVTASENEVTILKSGSCGENLSWSYTSDKVLTISGSGNMESYTYYNANDFCTAPWDEVRPYIRKVIIENGVTSVGRSAFFSCKQLEEIVLGDNVIFIDEHAFDSCSELRKIVFGKEIKKVYEHAFELCDSIEEVYGTDIETWCKIEFIGTYSNPLGNGLWKNNVTILYLDGIPVGEELVIPATVTEWGCATFQNYSAIKKVTIENGVTCIAPNAFEGCENLVDVAIPESVKKIGDSAFKDCSFQKINIPDSVEGIGNSSFSGCDQLKNIKLSSSLKTIGNTAFASCAFTSIEIPMTVVEIGVGAFQNCAVEEIEIPQNVTVIGNEAFKNCTNLNNIILPENLKEIGSQMFYGCSSLREVKLPEKIELIRNAAFEGCTNLTKITLPKNLVQIEANAFKNLNSLTDMELPDTLVNIGESAFYHLENWENVRIPSNVETIGNYAYSGCTHLQAIELSDNVTSVGKYAFENCIQVEKIKISENVTFLSDYMFKGCKSFENITIPSAIEELGNYVFQGCDNLKTIYFEGNAPKIAEKAFEGVIAICYYPKANESYTAEIITKDFGGDLLWTCEGEDKPDSFQKCGENIIWELNNEGVLNLVGTGKIYDYSVDDLVYAPWYEQRNSITSIKISEGITHIGNGAFYECAATDVEIPTTLCSIGDNAFKNCKITNIELPNGLVKIGNSAFYGTKITNIEIPNTVKEVGSAAFSKSLLENAVLPKGMTEIPEQMFKQCYYLYKVKFPEKLVIIGAEAFSNCYGLDSIVLPEGLISIGRAAFALCGACDTFGSYYPARNFSSVTLPSTVQIIEEKAFMRCEYLKTINIPKSIEKIGSYAFAYCFDLQTVTFEWNAPEIALEATFIQVEATCYYPSNNPEWNSNIMKNYYGKLTWVGKEMEIPSAGGGINPGESGDNQGNTDNGVPEEGGNTGENNNGSGGNGNENGSGNESGSGGNGNGSGENGSGIYTFEIKKQPQNQNIKKDEIAIFTLEVTGENLSYQWQYSNNSGKYWYKSGMEGADTATLSVKALEKRDGQQYRCVIKDGYGNSLASDVVILTLTKEESAIKITKQPENQNVQIGKNAIFEVRAEGENLSYQWQYSNNNGKYWYNSGMEGADTAGLSVKALEKRNGQQYRCVITDSEGNTLISDVAVLIITENVSNLKITEQPKNQSAEIGSTVSFCVVAEGTGLSYQWQYSTSGKYWFDSGMEGANTEILEVPVTLKRNGQQYRCVITDESGNKVITDVVMLMIE